MDDAGRRAARASPHDVRNAGEVNAITWGSRQRKDETPVQFRPRSYLRIQFTLCTLFNDEERIFYTLLFKNLREMGEEGLRLHSLSGPLASPRKKCSF